MRFSWRFFWIWVSSAFLLGLAAPTRSQSTFEGPLAAPGAALEKPVAKPKKHQAAKPAKTSKATQAGDFKQVPPRATPPVIPDQKTPSVSDPVSLGMKWNGSNDGTTQTRTQNYNGGAQGTGAEVGLKLHF